MVVIGNNTSIITVIIVVVVPGWSICPRQCLLELELEFGRGGSRGGSSFSRLVSSRIPVGEGTTTTTLRRGGGGGEGSK